MPSASMVPQPGECPARKKHNGAISVRGINQASKAWVLEIQMTATNNATGDSFSGPLYAYVQVR